MKKTTARKAPKKAPKKTARKITAKSPVALTAIKAHRKAAKAEKTTVIRQGDKAAFVRSQPRSTPASTIVAKAATYGMTISTAYVHNIRSAAGKRSRAILKKTAKPTIKGTKAQKEKAFQELVVTLGPARSLKLLQQTELALSQQG